MNDERKLLVESMLCNSAAALTMDEVERTREFFYSLSDEVFDQMLSEIQQKFGNYSFQEYSKLLKDIRRQRPYINNENTGLNSIKAPIDSEDVAKATWRLINSSQPSDHV